MPHMLKIIFNTGLNDRIFMIDGYSYLIRKSQKLKKSFK